MERYEALIKMYLHYIYLELLGLGVYNLTWCKSKYLLPYLWKQGKLHIGAVFTLKERYMDHSQATQAIHKTNTRYTIFSSIFSTISCMLRLCGR